MPASNPCSVPGFSRSKVLNSTSGKGRQLLHRAGEERRGNIAESIGVQAALEQRQHLGRQTTGAGADLEDAQSAPLRKMAGGFLNGRGNCRQAIDW